MENKSISQTLKERGLRYGRFDNHASISQALKAILKTGESWKDMSPCQKEALEMVCHKIGRIVNGDPNYLDSWVDIGGYCKLVIQALGEGVGDSD